MTRILFAWEMGRNFGHISTLAPLARALKKRDAQIYMALQNPMGIAEILPDVEVGVLTAPHVRPSRPVPGKRADPILCYADDIAQCGYGSAHDLSVLLRGWYTLYDLVMPDLVVAESAPTALLAARHQHIPTASVGTGYNNPPLLSPMPPLLATPDITSDTLKTHEARTLGIINNALDSLHQPHLTQLADLVHADHRLLTTFSELDHYGAREDEIYSGPLFAADAGDDPVWPSAPGKKIFAYIRPEHPLFMPVLQALRMLPYPALVVAPKVSSKITGEYTLPHLKIQSRPVKYSNALAQASLIIHHGSHGTSAAGFLAGKPQLALPGHIEQLMLARRLVETGAALLVHMNGQSAHVLQAVRDLMEKPEYAQKATGYATGYAGFDPVVQAQIIADRLYSVAAGDAPS